jgi:regulator of telomere elongation helicase 1
MSIFCWKGWYVSRLNYPSKLISFFVYLAFRKSVVENEILDIEELVQAASKARACPYYTCKDTQTAADIIFLPYNYLIDPYARRAQNIDLENCIIIFDEGTFRNCNKYQIQLIPP